MWADRRVIDLFGIEHPILLSPMANASTVDLAIAVSEAGGLGALPCGQLSTEQIRSLFGTAVQRTSRPLNANFFCPSSGPDPLPALPPSSAPVPSAAPRRIPAP